MTELDPKQAWELINNNKNNSELLILDFRRESDFNKNKIAGARNLPFLDENFEENLNNLNKNNRYLIYCASDAISNITFQMMSEMGFQYVFKLAGGISRWHKEDFPVEFSKGMKWFK
jgi:DNA phosphorothioation-dependent restriction protein DptG